MGAIPEEQRWTICKTDHSGEDYSGSAALEFFCLEDDEVLVEGLQRGVGEAGGAIEDRAAYEDHVEPFDSGSAGQAVEERLLVEAAGMEVRVAESGAERRVLQACCGTMSSASIVE